MTDPDTTAQGGDAADQSVETAENSPTPAPIEAVADPAAAPAADVTADATGVVDTVADNAAKAQGFANAQAAADAKAVAETSEKKAAKPRKGKAKAAATAELPHLADWLESGHGQLSIGMGDAAAPSDAVPPSPLFGVTRRNGRFVTDTAIVPRTARLIGAVTVTHAWLIDDVTPIAKCELAAPVTLQPNGQVEFRAGSLAFA